MNNFVKIDNKGIVNLHIDIGRLFALLDAFTAIIIICQKAKYPEDLEGIYDILDKYIPDWKNKDWRLEP